MFELDELRNVHLARNKEFFEKSFAEDAAQKCGYRKNRNRERHREIFVYVTCLDAFMARFPVESEEEQTEHVERREAACEER